MKTITFTYKSGKHVAATLEDANECDKAGVPTIFFESQYDKYLRLASDKGYYFCVLEGRIVYWQKIRSTGLR